MKSQNFEMHHDNLYFNRELILKQTQITDAWADFEVGKIPKVCKEHNMSESERQEMWQIITDAIIKGVCMPYQTRRSRVKK